MTIDFSRFTGLDKSFLPHYQFEQPIEFYSLVNHFMKYYYDEDKEPELYISNIRNAVKFANKSIMLEKLGIPSDFYDDDNFRKSFANISKSFDGLEVVGDHVVYHEDIKKSIGQEAYRLKNSMYETVFLKAYNDRR